jgi:D-alanine-D-alanine ligase
MKVALLHNPHPGFVAPGQPDDAYEEFDNEQTIDAIAAALGSLGVLMVPVVADRRLPSTLEAGRFDFVFNIAEGEGRRCREAIPAAVCELLGLPYTGSDPLTLAATLDKSIARRIVAPDVPVPNAVDPRYPVIVKPNDEGSSKGIRRDSLCFTAAEARDRARDLERLYGCPVLVEEFLPGPEVTVGISGNGNRLPFSA